MKVSPFNTRKVPLTTPRPVFVALFIAKLLLGCWLAGKAYSKDIRALAVALQFMGVGLQVVTCRIESADLV